MVTAARRVKKAMARDASADTRLKTWCCGAAHAVPSCGTGARESSGSHKQGGRAAASEACARPALASETVRRPQGRLATTTRLGAVVGVDQHAHGAWRAWRRQRHKRRQHAGQNQPHLRAAATTQGLSGVPFWCTCLARVPLRCIRHLVRPVALAGLRPRRGVQTDANLTHTGGAACPPWIVKNRSANATAALEGAEGEAAHL